MPGGAPVKYLEHPCISISYLPLHLTFSTVEIQGPLYRASCVLITTGYLTNT